MLLTCILFLLHFVFRTFVKTIKNLGLSASVLHIGGTLKQILATYKITFALHDKLTVCPGRQ